VSDVYARWAVASDLREMIDAEFKAHKIEIPFPQRVIWNGHDEAERALAAPPPAGTAEPALHGSAAEARLHQDGEEGDA